jgi:hypothetical protein
MERAMDVTKQASEQFVLRRVVSGGVVVGSYHPAIGPVFWEFVDNSDCNAPDHFGLTTDIEGAHRFRSEQVPFRNFEAHIWSCNEEEGEVTQGEPGGEDYSTFTADIPGGDFASLARQAGVEVGDIVGWFWATPWIEVPAPAKAYFLRDLNGVIGYRPEWTEWLGDAAVFSSAELEDHEDLDTMMARALGEFVPRASAGENLTGRVCDLAAEAAGSFNHALEADVAWTFHRFQVLYGGPRTFYGDLAMQHAGQAGRQHFVTRSEYVSGHIDAFPELRAAFDVGFAIAKHLAGAPDRAWSADATADMPNTAEVG